MQESILVFHGWRQLELPREIQVRKVPFPFIISYIMKHIMPRLSYISHFSSNGNRGFDDPHLFCLGQFSQRLESLDLRDTKVSEDGLLQFFSIHCGDCLECDGISGTHTRPLQRLALSNKSSVTDAVLELIGIRCPYLTELDLSQMRSYRFSDQGIITMVSNDNLTALKKLVLSGCEGFSDSALTSISMNCPNLEYFDCRGAFLIGDQGVFSLLEKCSMKYLDVSYCWRLTDQLFECLINPNMENPQMGQYLQELYFHFCYQLSDQTLFHISRLCNLNTLGLSNIEHISPSMKQRLLDKSIKIIE
jgi:hypothetical protein